MDKAYTTVFNAATKAIEQLQAVMIGLQAAQLEAEEIVMQTPHEDDEVLENE